MSGKTCISNTSIGRDGPDLYKKTIDHLDLYASILFKKSIDVILCLRSEEYVGHEAPVVPESPTANDNQVWNYNTNDLLKI